MITPSANRRLQIATRIHYALLRELGFGVDLGRLLKQPLYARDVLLVCDACAGNDLPRLARAFRGATHDAAVALAAGASETAGLSTFGSSMPWPASQASQASAESLPAE